MSWYKSNNYPISRGYQFFNKNEFYRFIKVNDFLEVSMKTPYNVRNFLLTGKNKYDRNSEYEYHGLEGLIHKPMIFKNRLTGKSCIVLQPYTYNERLTSISERVNLWAIRHNVHAEIYDSRFSWYYPGMTIFIVISLHGTHIRVRKIVNKEYRIDGWKEKAITKVRAFDNGN